MIIIINTSIIITYKDVQNNYRNYIKFPYVGILPFEFKYMTYMLEEYVQLTLKFLQTAKKESIKGIRIIRRWMSVLCLLIIDTRTHSLIRLLIAV